MTTKAKDYLIRASFLLMSGLLLIGASSSVSQQDILRYQKQLASKNPSKVFLAVSEIHQKLPRVASLNAGLKKILKNEAIEFRPLVAITLEKLGDPEGMRFLVVKAKDEKNALSARLKAMRYLGDSGKPKAVETLSFLLKSEDERIRAGALVALVRAVIYPSVDEAALFFEHASLSQKLVLLDALSKKEHSGEIVLLGLKDRNAAVAGKALQVLAASKNPESLLQIKKNLEEIQDVQVAMEAELILADRTQYEIMKIKEQYLAVNAQGRSNLVYFLKYREVFYKKGVKTAIDLLKSVETDTALLQEMEQAVSFSASSESV